MLKVKQSVSFDASTAWVGYNFDRIEFRDAEDNTVAITMAPSQLDQLIKGLQSRQAQWTKEQAEKFAKVED